MHGIVSLLDSEHEAFVLALWDELRCELGLAGTRATPFPHLTYQAAASYDEAALVVSLRAVAREQPPFTVAADGLGIFTRPAPILYIALLRTPELAAFQSRVWAAAAPAASALDAYFQPETWIPHITLALRVLDAERLGQAVRLLGTRPLRWQWRVDHLAYGADDGAGTHSELRWRLPLGE